MRRSGKFGKDEIFRLTVVAFASVKAAGGNPWAGVVDNGRAEEPPFCLPPMIPAVYSTTSFVDLEGFIHNTLCDFERFAREQTFLKKSLLRRGGRVVGLMLRLEESRQARSHAVWAADEYRVLFYNSAGQRCGEVKLAESPDLADAELRVAA